MLLTSRKLVRRVVIRLQVRIRHGHFRARNDGGDVVLGLVRKSLRQDVADCDVDRLLEEIVLEDDESSVDLSRVVHDRIPRVQHLHWVSLTASKVIV